MSFINPSYLWALLGLAIPIAIHLWSKKEGKTIKIGSIKLLNEEDSKQSSSISLNELILLFLRLSIITLLVLAMAEPQIKHETVNTPLTYIVEPSLIKNQEIVALLDSLKAESNVKLLQSGFPVLDDDTFERIHFQTPNYWQLAKDMEALHTDSIVVFTSAFTSNLKGKRPIVTKNIEWVILNTEKPEEQIIKASLKKDRVEFLSLKSNSERLSFKKEIVALSNKKIDVNDSKDSISLNSSNQKKQISLETEDSLSVVIYYEDELTNQAIYLDAAFKAISKHINRPIQINKIQDSTKINNSNKHLIWLSNTPTLRPVDRLLLYKPNDLSNSLITKGNSKNEFYLTKSLNTENIFDNHLTEQLLNWLNLHPELEEKIKLLDKRVVNKDELLPMYKEIKDNSSYIKTLSISKWIWMLLGLILVAERIIANIRKQ